MSAARFMLILIMVSGLLFFGCLEEPEEPAYNDTVQVPVEEPVVEEVPEPSPLPEKPKTLGRIYEELVLENTPIKCTFSSEAFGVRVNGTIYQKGE